MGSSFHLALEVLGDHPGQRSELDAWFWSSRLYAKSPGALQAQHQLVKWWQSKDLLSSLAKGGRNGKSSSLEEKGKVLPFTAVWLSVGFWIFVWRVLGWAGHVVAERMKSEGKASSEYILTTSWGVLAPRGRESLFNSLWANFRIYRDKQTWLSNQHCCLKKCMWAAGGLLGIEKQVKLKIATVTGDPLLPKGHLGARRGVSVHALQICLKTEGGNRQNRLHLESRTPSWAGLWTLSSMPSIYGNDIPTGKPGPQKEEPQGSPSPKRIP